MAKFYPKTTETSVLSPVEVPFPPNMTPQIRKYGVPRLLAAFSCFFLIFAMISGFAILDSPGIYK